jgi:hypothetical protein
VLELLAVAAVIAGILLAAVFAIAAVAIRIGVWIVLVPLRLLAPLVWGSFLLLRTILLAILVVLGLVAAPVLLLVVGLAGVALLAALLLPLLPVLAMGAGAWVLLRRVARPALA